jgi:thiamine-phosphate pyrophosphorylase
MRDPGRLHVVTDATLQDRHDHVALARLAAAGGADAVQLREKRPWTTRALVETARAVAAALAGSGTRLVVNDRVDVAAAAGAAGVHLGRDDLEVAVARRLLGPEILVGGTANSLEEARRVADAGVDYLGAGPVFGTTSKARPAPPLGLDGLRAIVRAVRCPVIAIGRITAERVPAVLEAGVHGVAVLSAVVCAPDPASATREIRRAMDGWGVPGPPAPASAGPAAIEIMFNGAPRIVRAADVAALLAEMGLAPGGPGLAVARNGEVVPRSQWGRVAIRAGDRLEVVGAVQGG